MLPPGTILAHYRVCVCVCVWGGVAASVWLRRRPVPPRFAGIFMVNSLRLRGGPKRAGGGGYNGNSMLSGCPRMPASTSTPCTPAMFKLRRRRHWVTHLLNMRSMPPCITYVRGAAEPDAQQVRFAASPLPHMIDRSAPGLVGHIRGGGGGCLVSRLRGHGAPLLVLSTRPASQLNCAERLCMCLRVVL